MPYNFFFLAILTAVGGLVTLEDLKTKKIKNKWLALGLLSGLILDSAFLIFVGLDPVYLGLVSLNFFSALAVGFLLWSLGSWPAGDAKLFALYVFLLPLHYYYKNYLPIFPGFALLLNIFIPFLTFLFLKSLFFLFLKIPYFLREKEKFHLFKNFSWSDFLKKTLLFVVLFNVLSVLILKSSFSWKNFLIYFFLFWSVEKIISLYLNIYSKEEIAIARLSARENLSEEIKNEPELLDSLGALGAEGLEEEQVEKIKKFFAQKGRDTIHVYRSLPFSLWIGLGVLLTVILKGNLMQYIQALLR